MIFGTIIVGMKVDWFDQNIFKGLHSVPTAINSKTNNSVRTHYYEPSGNPFYRGNCTVRLIE